jgi:tetratricopeptide (TPR) repeat protein
VFIARQFSLWITLLVLVLATILIKAEFHSQNASSKIKVINILPAPDTFEEESTIDSMTLEAAEKSLKVFVDELSRSTADDALSNLKLNALNEQQRIKVLLLLGRKYYQLKRYLDVTKVLAPIDAALRVQSNQQFIYAFSLAHSGDNEKAITAYQALLHATPNSQAAALNLATLFKSENQCKHALTAYRHAIQISSGKRKAKGLAGIGDCYYRLGNYSESIEAYTSSIEYRPDYAKTWLALAKAQSAKRMPYSQIQDSLNKAASLDKDNHYLLNSKAKLKMDNLDYQGAITTSNASLKIRQTSQAYKTKAWALLDLGKRNSARKSVNRAIQLNNSKRQKYILEAMLLYLNKNYDAAIEKTNIKKASPELLYLRASSYRKKGRFKSALKVLSKIQKSNALYWRSEVQKTRIFRSQKKYDRSIEMYAKLLSHCSDAEYLQFEQSLAYERMDKFKQALSAINHALEKTPENIVYALTKSRLLFKNNSPEQSIQQINRLLKKRPNYLRALKLKSDILLAKRDMDALIENYQNILFIDEEDIDTRLKLASLLYSSHENELAINHVKEVLVYNSAHTGAHILLAQLYVQTDDKDKAITQLKKVIKLKPGDQEASQLLMSLTEDISRETTK